MMNSKTLLTALATTAVLATGSTNAAPVLLGGYYGLNESGAALQSAAPGVSDISVTLARTGSSTDITQGFSQIDSTKWGNTTLDVAAPNVGNGDELKYSIVQTATASGTVGSRVFNPFTLVLTVTNNGTDDLELDKFHYIIKKDVNNVGPNSAALTYTSGDLTDADGTNTVLGIANGVNGVDVDLSSFLTDTKLAAGESAVFTWSHGVPQDIDGNTALRIDNLAISGEVLPEPSSLALLGLGGLLVARRRRG